MPATCHPIPQTEAQEMLLGVVHAICDRPGETAAQREAREREVVRSVLAFGPRDPVEIMLASMAVGHYHLILDSLHSAFCTAADGTRGRTNSALAGLDRAMTGLLKELRIAQTRPVEGAADVPRQGASATVKHDVEARQPPPAPEPPPLRRTETSEVAMTAVVSPSMKPLVVGAGATQGDQLARPGAGPVTRNSPGAAVGAPEDVLPGLAQMPATLRSAADRVPDASSGV